MAKDIVNLPVADLIFDYKNPRLVEFDFGPNTSDDEMVKCLWDTMDVRELVMSITASGFFRHEPVVVTEEEGKHVVIEGNRRLAAVKVILNADLARNLGVDIPPVSASVRRDLETLPAIRDTRQGAWRYLGFKHVNGPAKWSGYAKSQYIAEVHRAYSVSLSDIARQIGDTHRTVQRLFRGLMVLETAEEWGVFDRGDRWRRHFSFSHLYTGLGYTGIAEFIGVRSETEEDPRPIPTNNRKELGELCTWLYGSKKHDTPPVVQSQNPHLRQLEAVVSSKEAVAALRVGKSLAYAYEASRPSTTVFEESLFRAKSELQKAHGTLSVGYDGSEELLGVAGTVADLAFDLYEDMSRKRSPRRRRPTTEEA